MSDKEFDEFHKHELMDRISCVSMMFDSMVTNHLASSLLREDIDAISVFLADLYQKAGCVGFSEAGNSTITALERDIASSEAYDSQSFIDGACWAEEKLKQDMESLAERMSNDPELVQSLFFEAGLIDADGEWTEHYSYSEGDIVQFDLERMKKAMESGTIKVPPGLSMEEQRKFICDYAEAYYKELLQTIVDFAYEQGFPKLGYDIVKAVDGLNRKSALEEAAKVCDDLAEIFRSPVFDIGYIVAARVAAREIRELKENTDDF